MAQYYIDPVCGLDTNDGLSADKPKKTNANIDVKGGDTILFKRGSVIRDRLYAKGGNDGEPITYCAYGDGEKPIFMLSEDLSSSDKWFHETDNIWVMDSLITGVCNFVFDNGAYCGNMCWEKSEMSKQGDWNEENGTVRLYSSQNPGEIYSHIEVVHGTTSRFIDAASNMNISDLAFANSNFALAASRRAASRNVNITNCEFKFIGGGVWNRELKIRFGNAIEFWDYCENVTISHCLFDNVYDSCVTHQGDDKCQAPFNIEFNGNLFMNYGMAAYECRDVMPIDGFFNDNICINAGGGFSIQNETPPRQSEIYPQPMGHHVFIWRIDMPTPNGCLEIKRNIFYNAPIGSAIYSIVPKYVENQISIDSNVYYTENVELLNKLGSKCYSVEEFEKFKQETSSELNGKYEKVNIDAIVSEWKKRK